MWRTTSGDVRSLTSDDYMSANMIGGFRASSVSGFVGHVRGPEAVVLPLALLASTLCLAHIWPLVSAFVIAVTGLVVAAMAWRDCKLGVRINWREKINPEHFIPVVIEEECCDYDTVKNDEDGPHFWPEKRAEYEQYKSEDGAISDCCFVSPLCRDL